MNLHAPVNPKAFSRNFAYISEASAWISDECLGFGTGLGYVVQAKPGACRHPHWQRHCLRGVLAPKRSVLLCLPKA